MQTDPALRVAPGTAAPGSDLWEDWPVRPGCDTCAFALSSDGNTTPDCHANASTYADANQDGNTTPNCHANASTYANQDANTTPDRYICADGSDTNTYTSSP